MNSVNWQPAGKNQTSQNDLESSDDYAVDLEGEFGLDEQDSYLSSESSELEEYGISGDYRRENSAMDASEKQALVNKIEEFKAELSANANLRADPAALSESLKKLDALLKRLQQAKNEDAIYSVEEEFTNLEAELRNLGQYAPAVNRLAKTLGQDSETVAALLEKHGINPNQTITLPDSKVAALLNDPELSSNLESLKDSVKQADKNLKDRIKLLKETCRAWNQAEAAETSATTDVPDEFKQLYDESKHEGEFSQALLSARVNLAEEQAKILGALSGKQVSAISDDPEKAGSIQIKGGGTFNMIPDNSNAKIEFSTKSVAWPEIELVVLSVDREGDGQTSVPTWMEEANYPQNVFEHPDDGTWRPTIGNIFNGAPGPFGFFDDVTSTSQDILEEIPLVGGLF